MSEHTRIGGPDSLAVLRTEKPIELTEDGILVGVREAHRIAGAVAAEVRQELRRLLDAGEVHPIQGPDEAGVAADRVSQMVMIIALNHLGFGEGEGGFGVHGVTPELATEVELPRRNDEG